MAERSGDIRERGIFAAGTNNWDYIAARYGRSNSQNSGPRRPRDYEDVPVCVDPYTVMKPREGKKPYIYYVCKRLGIPYDPNYVHLARHRGYDPESDSEDPTDVPPSDESPSDDSPDDNSSKITSSTMVLTTEERQAATKRSQRPLETWVLDSEYLEYSYLLNGNPDPDCLVWEADAYDAVWISVGLALDNNAFKHVSTGWPLL